MLFRAIQARLTLLQRQFQKHKYMHGNKYLHATAVRLVKLLLRLFDTSLRERIDLAEGKYINRELLSETVGKFQRGQTLLQGQILGDTSQSLKQQVNTLQNLESVYYTKGLESDHPLQVNHERAGRLKAQPWGSFKNDFPLDVRRID